MAIEAIRNFVALSPGLATAGQPSERHVEELARAGFEVVINLAAIDPRCRFSDEAGLVRSLGLTYHHIPVDFKAPTLSDLERFFTVMEASRGKKIFVHCAANFRVSAFIALYGQARLGWTLEQADAHIKRIWVPDEVWQAFITSARQAGFVVDSAGPA
jgi:protein tyrosine phosphatase (PTP) superfamily phosphohydrolase (DUF442 family)